MLAGVMSGSATISTPSPKARTGETSTAAAVSGAEEEEEEWGGERGRDWVAGARGGAKAPVPGGTSRPVAPTRAETNVVSGVDTVLDDDIYMMMRLRDL